MLNVLNLGKSFGKINIVDNVNFELKEGTINSLVGTNGSGKTTILDLISGILEKDRGKIFFNGEEIGGRTFFEISSLGVSRTFQTPKLFGNLTVRENLLLALSNEDTKFWKNLICYRFIEEDFKKVFVVTQILELDGLLQKKPSELSFGQKKLVEFARSILMPHKLLILDEILAGINSRIKWKIFSVIKKLKREGSTIFLVEHDMDFVKMISDEIFVMKNGKIISKKNNIST